jgi:three-Cys-motif partner protein
MVLEMEKKENVDYLKEFINSKNAKEIIESSSTTNEEGFDVWSFKKLIFLEYYLKPFLFICENNGFKCIFIDFFSSCGANKIKDEKIVSIGSPIISLLKGVIKNKKKGTNNRFYKWFFLESDSSFCASLKERVTKTSEIVNKEFGEDIKLGKDVFVIEGDCNQTVPEVINSLKKESETEKIAVLAFIDPYNFRNLEWETWKNLCSLKTVDILFTFPIQTIERGYKMCKDLEKYLSPSLVSILKGKEIGVIPETEFERAYAKDMASIVSRSISHYDIGIDVKNLENREIYRIDLFTHSSPALKAVLPKAKELDNLSSNCFKTLLKQACGKQESIKKWF